MFGRMKFYGMRAGSETRRPIVGFELKTVFVQTPRTLLASNSVR